MKRIEKKDHLFKLTGEWANGFLFSSLQDHLEPYKYRYYDFEFLIVKEDCYGYRPVQGLNCAVNPNGIIVYGFRLETDGELMDRRKVLEERLQEIEKELKE